MIKENNKHPPSPKRELTVQEFPLAHVKINPQARVRQEFGDYKNDLKYIALRESMAKFGLRNPISLNSNCVLVEGFRRFSAATDLGWETIPTIIDHLTEMEALELELEENFLRKDFTDYQVYIGVARLKRLHEKEYPKTKRGKYDRSSKCKQDHKTIFPSGGNMINNSPSFSDTYCSILGLKKSALYNKTQIGEAILNNKFNSKTIKAIKDERITQKQLLQKLRQIENKKIIRDKLEDVLEVPTTTSEKIPEKNLLINDESHDVRNPSTTDAQEFIKAEKIIKAGINDPEAQQLVEKVKKNEISLDAAEQNVNKIEPLNKSIREYNITKYKEAGNKFKRSQNKLTSMNNKKKTDYGIEEKYENDNCGSCSLAHLFVMDCYKCDTIAKCIQCKTPVYAVICEHDIIKGVPKFRNPNLKKCKYSPEHIPSNQIKDHVKNNLIQEEYL